MAALAEINQINYADFKILYPALPDVTLLQRTIESAPNSDRSECLKPGDHKLATRSENAVTNLMPGEHIITFNTDIINQRFGEELMLKSVQVIPATTIDSLPRRTNNPARIDHDAKGDFITPDVLQAPVVIGVVNEPETFDDALAFTHRWLQESGTAYIDIYNNPDLDQIDQQLEAAGFTVSSSEKITKDDETWVQAAAIKNPTGAVSKGIRGNRELQTYRSGSEWGEYYEIAGRFWRK